MLALQLDSLNDWAYSVNLTKIKGVEAASNLEKFKENLEEEAEIEAVEVMRSARTARLGDQYKDLPLLPQEQKLLKDLRKKKGSRLHPFLAYIAYAHIKTSVENSLESTKSNA